MPCQESGRIGVTELIAALVLIHGVLPVLGVGLLRGYDILHSLFDPAEKAQSRIRPLSWLGESATMR